MRKKNIINGLIGAVGFLIVAFIGFSIRFGLPWWISSENEVLIFFPMWTIVAVYVGYSASAYYYKEKALIYAKEEDLETLNENWKSHKYLMVSNFLMKIAKLFAIMTPIYVLVYIDGSTILKSSLGLIITFAIITVLCYVLSKMLVKRTLAKNI